MFIQTIIVINDTKQKLKCVINKNLNVKAVSSCACVLCVQFIAVYIFDCHRLAWRE